MGIEPTSEAWEASILPLYDARSLFLIILRHRFSVQPFRAILQLSTVEFARREMNYRVKILCKCKWPHVFTRTLIGSLSLSREMRSILVGLCFTTTRLSRLILLLRIFIASGQCSIQSAIPRQISVEPQSQTSATFSGRNNPPHDRCTPIWSGKCGSA